MNSSNRLYSKKVQLTTFWKRAPNLIRYAIKCCKSSSQIAKKLTLLKENPMMSKALNPTIP